MYIKKLIYENVGPIHNAYVTFPFKDSGEPKPIIFVGENGSGKSTILSNIVDAFYEMAGKAFDNAWQTTDGYGHQYYKSISSIQISSGENYMFSFIDFKGKIPCFYLCKSGDASVDFVKSKTGFLNSRIKWGEKDNFKASTIEKKTAEEVWNSTIMCYFGPDRYERPVWMGDKYYQTNDFMHPTIRQKVAGHLDKPITVKNVTAENLSWLLDVIADSRFDMVNNKIPIKGVDLANLVELGKARVNLEKILSNIIGEDVYFSLNFRNRSYDRFKILRKKDDSMVAPTLDSLSTGQIALFNLFATIVRYADYNNIYQSINLSDITGIVVIDEIELHLHTKLQKEVLPELIKLFPKIQFVITTHAPLFLLGMKEIFGEDGFEIYELPQATKINTERFHEFQKAYEYLKETETYQQNVKNALASVRSNGNAIIVTEGSTDWKHLKAAYENLRDSGIYDDLFDGMEFEFFEYESSGNIEAGRQKLEMGNKVLIDLCANMAKLPQTVKYIFIADRDDTQTNKKMSDPGALFKKWGNNVYSFILPVPLIREATPAISIEHYYTDDEIKTEWIAPDTGIAYRLFLGNEFDERGIAMSIDKFCEKRSKCGSSSIAIIEGSTGERVTSIHDNNGINYALSKSKFADMILGKIQPFDKFNFENFIAVFRIIKDIINDN